MLLICALFIWNGPSWPRSYGSWINNYLCNRCLSPLMLWVRVPLRMTCTTLRENICQWLAAGRWFLVGPRFSPPMKLTSFPVVEWFCLFIDLWVLTFPLEDCSVFCNFVITLIYHHDITEILLKVAFSTIKPNQTLFLILWYQRIAGKYLLYFWSTGFICSFNSYWVCFG